MSDRDQDPNLLDELDSLKGILNFDADPFMMVADQAPFPARQEDGAIDLEQFLLNDGETAAGEGQWVDLPLEEEENVAAEESPLPSAQGGDNEPEAGAAEADWTDLDFGEPEAEPAPQWPAVEAAGAVPTVRMPDRDAAEPEGTIAAPAPPTAETQLPAAGDALGQGGGQTTGGESGPNRASTPPGESPLADAPRAPAPAADSEIPLLSEAIEGEFDTAHGDEGVTLEELEVFVDLILDRRMAALREELRAELLAELAGQAGLKLPVRV
jgi:hypothetical protein